MSFAGLAGVYPPLSNNGGTPTPSSHRFVPHNFQYNGRVALALLPSLGVSLAAAAAAAPAAAASLLPPACCRRPSPAPAGVHASL